MSCWSNLGQALLVPRLTLHILRSLCSVAALSQRICQKLLLGQNTLLWTKWLHAPISWRNFLWVPTFRESGCEHVAATLIRGGMGREGSRSERAESQTHTKKHTGAALLSPLSMEIFYREAKGEPAGWFTGVFRWSFIFFLFYPLSFSRLQLIYMSLELPLKLPTFY